MKRAFVIAAILSMAAMRVAASTMTVAQYAASLDRLGALIGGNRLDAARGEAQALMGTEVDAPNARFLADGTLLAEVAALTRADVHVRERLATTAAELR